MSRKTGRPPAGQERLTVERILDAAMEIVDQNGMGALSMRRLGKSLNVDPMAIYHHLPNKDAVITGLVDRAFEEIARTAQGDESEPWRARVRRWAIVYQDAARRHPSLFVHLIANAGAATDSVMRVNEQLYAALAASGMGPRDVVHAADMIVDYVHGAILSMGLEPAREVDWRQVVEERVNAAPDNELSTLKWIVESLQGERLSIDIEFGLDVILAGLKRHVPGEV